MILTGRQKRFLRAQAHALKPLVHVGKQGVVGTVIAQTEQCLAAHELVKVKVLESCPLDRHACGAALAEATGAQVAQTLGRTVLLYRADPEAPRLQLPSPQQSSPQQPSLQSPVGTSAGEAPAAPPHPAGEPV